MSLAQVLIEQGLLAPEQLRSIAGVQNLEDQQLGSHLCSAGLLDTDQLAHALSLLYGVPPALNRDFERADPALRKKLRNHQAANFKAIPLYTTAGRRIAVAMVNPGHPKIVDELSFILGAAIEPMVTSEAALGQQLEVLYAMPKRRTTGFHPVANMHAAIAGSVPLRTPSPDQQRMDVLPMAVNAEDHFMSSPTPPRNHLNLPRGRRTMHETQSYLSAVEDLPYFAPADPRAPTRATDDGASLTPIPPRVAITGPDRAVEQILASPDRQAAADNLFEFMRSCFGAGAMFVVGPVFAEGRFGYNEGAPCPAVEKLVFSLSLPSCFHEAHTKSTMFLGAPPANADRVHRPLWDALGCAPPREVLVAPVVTGGQVALLLYAQGHKSGRIEKFAARRMEHVASALANALLRLAG
jgi:hypothetical protein